MLVSIGIPTYNERANIAILLQDIERAKMFLGSSCHLTEILIADGGSTDGTVEEVNRAQRHIQTKIRVFEHPKRAGKFENLNWIFSHAATDILVCLDGDVRLPEKSLSCILSCFDASQQPGVVWGTDIPSRRDFSYRASAFQMNLENRKRAKMPKNTTYAAGVFFALRKEVYTSFRFVAGRIADDIALVDYVKERGLRAWQDPEIAVIAVPAGSFHDFYLQAYRGFSALELRRKNYSTVHGIPFRIAITARIEQAIADPLGAFLCSLYRIGCLVQHTLQPVQFTDTWPIARSTKGEFVKRDLDVKMEAIKGKSD